MLDLFMVDFCFTIQLRANVNIIVQLSPYHYQSTELCELRLAPTGAVLIRLPIGGSHGGSELCWTEQHGLSTSFSLFLQSLAIRCSIRNHEFVGEKGAPQTLSLLSVGLRIS